MIVPYIDLQALILTYFKNKRKVLIVSGLGGKIKCYLKLKQENRLFISGFL